MTDDIRHTLCRKTKRYRTTLWLVHNLISNSSAKENGCTPRMETKVGPLCSQDWKIQQKEVSPLSDP